MKRTTKLAVAVLVVLAAVTGVAVAASSPTVTTGGASKITNITATLTGTVNPNGNETGYVFQYGLTNAYGLSTNSHTISSGTKPVKVSLGIANLTPGTVYHYRIAAVNRSGGSFGRDRTFKTTGPPPPTPVTGSAVNVGKSTATITGSLTTNGTTTAYGAQTFTQTVPAASAPVPVSVALSGLAPATLFHYRIVAFHGSHSTTYGADATFFTEPLNRPKPRLSTRTRPSHDASKPYTFSTGGTLHGDTFIPALERCAGNVGLRYRIGKHQIGFVVVPVGTNCKFAASDSFRHIHLHGPTSIRISIDFRGNGYIRSVTHYNTVTAG
jgi:hypothetical protein